MMTINPAASLDYYLATAADADGLPVVDASAGMETVRYYQPKHDTDPLARPGRWFGKMADSFGLRSGDPVDARTFANLYFGRTPDGRKTLTNDMPGIAEQREANRRKAKAESELAVAGQAFAEARVTARVKRGRSGSDIDRDPDVLLARERLDRAKRNRKAASGDPGTRQPAHDLAFGAPKDVSLLLMALHAEGKADEARAIEQAFARSVEQTLAAIERDFLLDRPRDGEGNRSVQGIAGCAGAMFLHFDARPVDGVTDPHLHAHALVFSPVATLDGEVRSVWTKHLSDHQHVLGAMQRALFANALKGLGYEVEPDVQKRVASFRLQGLDDRQRAAFSKRSLQVEAAQREGLTGRQAKLKNRAAKFDRLSGQDLIDLTASRLRENGLDAKAIASPRLESRLRHQIVQRMHRERAEELRGGESARVKVPGTPAWDAAVDRRLAAELRRIREPLPMAPETILDACLEMEAWFSVRDIERKIWEAAAHADIRPIEGESREAATLRWGQEMLETILVHPDLIRVQYEGGLGPQGLDRGGLPIFTTRKQRERETEVYGDILPRLANATGFSHIDESVAHLRITTWEAAQAERGRPIRLSDNQKQAVADLVSSDARLHVVSAWAGAGKTTMANAAVSLMQEMELEVIAVAPSNAAAEGLRKEIGAAVAFTPEALQLAIQNGRLRITDKTVIYCDEASMLDFAETRNMLLALKDKGRIVLQGDVRQLQAVGMGNVLKRVLSMPQCQLGRRPRLVSHLTRKFSDYVHIQRQREVWAKKVVAWAELGHVTKAFDELDRRGLIERHAGEDATLRAAVRGFASEDGKANRVAPAQPDEIATFHRARIMIASTNARVARLNELAREELKAAGLLGKHDWLVAASQGRCLRVSVGERLIFTEKAGHGDVKIGDGGRQKVMKSAIGTVTAVSMRRGEPVLTMALDDGRRVEVDSRHFGGLDHAYALTINKSQGMSVDRVTFVGATFNNAELMLVALSRFKEKLTVHVAEHEVEAVRNSCARVTEKLEANDLHALDLGVDSEADSKIYKAVAGKAEGRMSALGDSFLHLPNVERALDGRQTSAVAQIGKHRKSQNR
jgi:conjugative relaxase-like TrwC/TraI family protein